MSSQTLQSLRVFLIVLWRDIAEHDRLAAEDRKSVA